MKTLSLDVINTGTPIKTAELFRMNYRRGMYRNLISQQNEWLNYNGAAYESVEGDTVIAHVSEYMAGCVTMKAAGQRKKPLPFEPKKGDVGEVVAALKNLCHKERNTMSPPCWLSSSDLPAKNMISFQNGLLDVETRELYEPTPAFFTRTALPMSYDPGAPEPKVWLSFLNETLQANAEMIELVRQMMGYLISTDTSLQKIFFLHGKIRAGKGTILRVLELLVGKGNCCFPSIESLGEQFGMQDLIGKALAQVTDLNADARAKMGTAASRMNAVSGEDGITIDRKYNAPWNGTLPTRFVVSGNTMPNFGSHTLAMAARLLIIPFEVSFVGREDRGLTEKLKAELPGILNWALDGLDTIRLMGEIEEPAESKVSKLRLIYKSDPIHGFIAEHCELDLDDLTDRHVFYDVYMRYCKETGSHPVAMKDLTTKLEELFPITNKRRRTEKSGGKQDWFYFGVRFNAEAAAMLYQLDPFAVDLDLLYPATLMRDADDVPVLARGRPEDFAA